MRASSASGRYQSPRTRLFSPRRRAPTAPSARGLVDQLPEHDRGLLGQRRPGSSTRTPRSISARTRTSGRSSRSASVDRAIGPRVRAVDVVDQHVHLGEDGERLALLDAFVEPLDQLGERGGARARSRLASLTS